MFSRTKKSNKGIFSTLFQKDETVAEQLARFDDFDDDEDLSFEDISGNITFPPRRVADPKKLGTIGTVLSLVGLAAAGVGIAAAVKKSKKKEVKKVDLVLRLLNNKSIEDLRKLVEKPNGKSKEQLVNEIQNKLK